ncbi:MAG: aminoacyl-tRNA hydrolase [Rhodospirillales bacterium]|nr:aminoacyl-tRNA hydrolase [Rhodospirillales bacterium]
MLVLVGLGNPGPQYANNRHNFGFMVAEEIARRYGFSAERSRFQSYVSSGEIDGQKTLLLRPKTYMNLSGRAVSSALRFHKIRAREVIVMHDELDLVLGKIRVKRGGGAGGHNGLRSLDSNIGKDYQRIRMGIGHPGEKHQVERYVLSNFHKSEMDELRGVIDAVAEAIPILIAGDEAGFMTRVALIHPPPKSEPKSKSGSENTKTDKN